MPLAPEIEALIWDLRRADPWSNTKGVEQLCTKAARMIRDLVEQRAPQTTSFTPTHRHYKGGLYQVLHDDAKLEANMSPAVVYKGEDGQVWVRTKTDFEAKIDNPVPRFTKLTPEVP